MLLRGAQDLLNVLQMFYLIFVEDKDLIHIYDHKIIVQYL